MEKELEIVKHIIESILAYIGIRLFTRIVVRKAI